MDIWGIAWYGGYYTLPLHGSSFSAPSIVHVLLLVYSDKNASHQWHFVWALISLVFGKWYERLHQYFHIVLELGWFLTHVIFVLLQLATFLRESSFEKICVYLLTCHISERVQLWETHTVSYQCLYSVIVLDFVSAYCASGEWLRFDLFDKIFTVHPALVWMFGWYWILKYLWLGVLFSTERNRQLSKAKEL